MRTACKIILNGGTLGLSLALERVLTSPIVRATMMRDADCDALLDRLSKIDLRAVDGRGDEDSLLAILSELVTAGVVDPEVWRLYCKPASSTRTSSGGEGL